VRWWCFDIDLLAVSASSKRLYQVPLQVECTVMKKRITPADTLSTYSNDFFWEDNHDYLTVYETAEQRIRHSTDCETTTDIFEVVS